MPISDFYTGSGTVTLSSTAQTAVMSVYGTAAKRGWLVGVRVKVGVTGAVAGNQVYFALSRSTATNTATGLASGGSHDYSAPGSILQFATTWSTPPTFVANLAEWDVPQTTGSMWEEFPPTGDEWGVQAIANANANAGIHLFATASVATSTPVKVDFIWSE